MRAEGIRLSLDDFGTGYSSLSSLHLLPVDALKIDRSFIRDLGTETANARLVEAAVRLAQSLRLSVVAEDVENHLQLAALSGVGCEYVQGFLFEKPHSAGSIEELLRQTRVAADTLRCAAVTQGHRTASVSERSRARSPPHYRLKYRAA